MTPDQFRHVKPATRPHLWKWVKGYTGVSVAHAAVCEGHSAPFDCFSQAVLERPAMALWHAPRGSGKSFLSAIDTHFQSRFHPRHKTRVLGGSKAQSSQVYEALQEAVIEGRGPLGSDADTIADCLAETARYCNGSEVKILAAGPKSVRGPHPQSLKLDEVDEIDPDVRESAIGSAMEKHGQPTSILMTSTWHKPGGPMSDLIERGRAGAFPTHTFCAFEVLERCPDERSGPNLERCGECPLVSWCHSDRDRHPSGLPKAKRSSGHYTINSLIQKAQLLSLRAFNSDFLCLGPKVDGVWFSRFSDRNITPRAEYDPLLGPVEISIDSGVWTGAVFAQVGRGPDGIPFCRIFDEYLSFDLGAAANAASIVLAVASRCGDVKRKVSTDSAGGSANPVGITVFSEYEAAGLRGDHGLERWPKYPGCVIDGLNLIESFVSPASGPVRLLIHPRCVKLIQAFQAYSRKKVQGQYLEVPEDPQHPHEDLIDAVRGLLKLRFPDANRPERKPFTTKPSGRVFV